MKNMHIAIQVGRVVDMISKSENEAVKEDYQRLRTQYMASLTQISPMLQDIVGLKANIVELQSEKEELEIRLNTAIADNAGNELQIEELNTKKLAMSQKIKELKAQIKDLDPQVASKMEKFNLRVTNALQAANTENERQIQIIAQKDQELAQKDQALAQKDRELKVLENQYNEHKAKLLIGDVAFKFEKNLLRLFNDMFTQEALSFAEVCETQFESHLWEIQNTLNDAKEGRTKIAHPVQFGTPTDVVDIAHEFDPLLGKIAESLVSWSDFSAACILARDAL